MNISFTPHELLHTFEVLTKNQMIFPEDDEKLLNKFRAGILIALSKLHDEDSVAFFQAWEEMQSKKIKDLEKQNEDVLKDIPKSIK
jgi:hypothetical protein